MRLFERTVPELTDCDVLIVDSKVHRKRWVPEPEAVLEEFSRLVEAVPALLYFDTTDSAGWLQTKLLPVVRRYYKSQLYADRSRYRHGFYGNRIYADYYHRKTGVMDRRPELSEAVRDPAHLEKLAVSWNSGLADYSRFGPLRMALYQRLRLAGLLQPPRSFTPPDAPRPLDLSARFGITYDRDSVAWQRREMKRRLRNRMPTDKLRRGRYFTELRHSKIVVSPFGWGEITMKDFEVFLTGGLLLKPDMSHMETWPDFFRAGETIATHCWDFGDFDAVLDAYLADDRKRVEIAQQGQDLYRKHVASNDGRQRFAEKFRGIVDNALAQVAD